MAAQILKFPSRNTVLSYHYHVMQSELTVKYVARTVTYVDVPDLVYIALQQSDNVSKFIALYVADRYAKKRYYSKQRYTNNVYTLTFGRSVNTCIY